MQNIGSRTGIARNTKPLPPDRKWTIYILSQAGRSLFEKPVQGSRQYYTGVTSNLKKRIQAHNSGHTRATRGIEWELVEHIDGFTREEAFALERFLKTGDTLRKRAEFYEWAERIRTTEVYASHYYAHLTPSIRHLKWFKEEKP